jgi:uncharacterized protein (TIGR02001 family)
MMKTKLLNSLILAALVVPSVAMAEEKSPISANVSITTDYLFRGITQSSHSPAIQGGFDYAHDSGLYLGTWGSSVGWIQDYQKLYNQHSGLQLKGKWLEEINII